jgi:hypothetical protein
LIDLEKEAHVSCQLKYLTEIKTNDSLFTQAKWRLNRFIFNLLLGLSRIKSKLLINLKLASAPEKSESHLDRSLIKQPVDQFEPGDVVKVRSREEIEKTLNSFAKGFTCLKKMYDDCGKEFMVYKRVRYFFDEVEGKIRKSNNMYFLKKSNCTGEQCKCCRHCFYFWHASWLKKISIFVFIIGGIANQICVEVLETDSILSLSLAC